MDDSRKQVTPELAAKNRRLAIFLGVVALAFYAGFIFMQWHH